MLLKFSGEMSRAVNSMPNRFCVNNTRSVTNSESRMPWSIRSVVASNVLNDVRMLIQIVDELLLDAIRFLNVHRAVPTLLFSSVLYFCAAAAACLSVAVCLYLQAFRRLAQRSRLLSGNPYSDKIIYTLPHPLHS